MTLVTDVTASSHRSLKPRHESGSCDKSNDSLCYALRRWSGELYINLDMQSGNRVTGDIA